MKSHDFGMNGIGLKIMDDKLIGQLKVKEKVHAAVIRTIQYPDEQLKEIGTAQYQELTCLYVLVQGCGHQPVMTTDGSPRLDDTQRQCDGYRKYHI